MNYHTEIERARQELDGTIEAHEAFLALVEAYLAAEAA